MRQYELVERVKAYDPNADETGLNRAYVFSMVRHGAQTRASGDPYFSHPVEVAGISTELKLDSASIITALLHDTVEDGVATEKEIRSLFGKEIARLVDGVTKLSKVELPSDPTRRQSENFRKFLLAMSDDIRVLLIKLADRLHNMRTLHFIREPERRRRIAAETMEIYAPLAERIGMQTFRDELEDHAFAELNPEARDSLEKRVAFLRESNTDLIDRILAELRATIEQAGITADVGGREKRLYSIWRKMETKHVPFEDISDIVAFRLIVSDVETCYRALGVIHTAYRMIPNRFKDYISTPKPNGYQSLHTTVIGPEQRRIEIQIRTPEMHEVGEIGVAAHWVYKQQSGDRLKSREGRQYRWIRELLEILEHASGPEEFIEHTKLEMFRDQVFCFSPKGDLITLPRGASVVDFAYAVHSDIGDTCVGAKINGRHAPLRTVLNNGDQVEILCSQGQSPDPQWENFVVTGKARARIRRFIRLQENSEYERLGRSMLDNAAQAIGQTVTDRAVAAISPKVQVRNADQVYVCIGRGELSCKAVLRLMFPELVSDQDTPIEVEPRRTTDGAGPIPIRGLTPGMAVHLADCCNPLPGERIVGVLIEGKGVTVHTIDCETLEQFADAPERWLDLSWDREQTGESLFTGRINATLRHQPGSLNALTMAVARSHGNISNLKITYRSPDFFEMVVDVEVRDVRHLTNIVQTLRTEPAVFQVDRVQS